MKHDNFVVLGKAEASQDWRIFNIVENDGETPNERVLSKARKIQQSWYSIYPTYLFTVGRVSPQILSGCNGLRTLNLKDELLQRDQIEELQANRAAAQKKLIDEHVTFV